MATQNTQENRPSEVRRLQALQRQRADAVLRTARRAQRCPKSQIDSGFGESSGPGRLAGWIAELRRKHPDRRFADAFRLVLEALAHSRSPLLDQQRHVDAAARLARHSARWIRVPQDWRPRTHNAARQFASLARHLLTRYDVPAFFDEAWSDDSDWDRRAQDWFIHVGSGQNLRTAEGLPFPLTKLMAHHALRAPDHCTVPEALRWGQVLALGGSPRLAHAILGTRLRAPCRDEPFWLTVAQFFVHHPLLDLEQVGPIVDWIHAQRFEPQAAAIVGGVLRPAAGPVQPKLSIKGRTPQSILRQVREWHRALGRGRGRTNLVWAHTGIKGFERVEGESGNQRLWTITELLSSVALREEGRHMRHCVGTYDRSCAAGNYAIFSMALDSGRGAERRLTIAVNPRTRTIVEARTRYNRAPEPLDVRILRAWAASSGLSIGTYALVSRYGW